jgi:hypothetical protein
MKAMRKEITRLNKIIGKGCMDDKTQINDKKKDEPKGSQFKKGRCWCNTLKFASF